MLIETTRLTKRYKGAEAVSGLDLKVPEHAIFGFLGPNGAGKTTTMKLLLGLAHPTSGGGTIFGLDIVQESVAIRKRVGYLAQDPRFYPHMTARETLRFIARFFYSGPRRAIETRIEETLSLVGLTDKADRPIKGFSGGELQRLGIAQAQINHPDLLILDEPAAALDPMGRKDVLDVMERLRQHCTIFYSTHILEDVQRVSDTVAIMSKGKLVAQAPIAELLTGNGNTVYSVHFRGRDSASLESVRRQPWVSSVEVVPEKAHTRWLVAVTNPQAAEARLLRLILDDEDCTVTEFGPQRFNLEEVFLNLVGGEQDAG